MAQTPKHPQAHPEDIAESVDSRRSNRAGYLIGLAVVAVVLLVVVLHLTGVIRPPTH